MKVVRNSSILIACILVLTGCSNGAIPSPTPTAKVTPATSSCTTSQLSIVLGTESAAMGARAVAGMGFKNISSTACTLIGYPKIQMVDSMGKSIPTFVTDVPALMGIKSAVNLISVNPGDTAIFNLMYESGTGYANAICPTSSSVEFTAPGTTQILALPWKIQPYGGATIAELHCGEIQTSAVYLPK